MATLFLSPAAPSSSSSCLLARRQSSTIPFALSKSTNLIFPYHPLPSPTASSLFFSQRRPISSSVSTAGPALSTVARLSETQAPVLEAETEAESPPVSETSELAQATLPAPKREEIFAVVMVGSRQYIVFPGRWIITQRLKGADVNDKIVLNKVLLVGTKEKTFIGKPVVTNAAVHAVVEEQLLDKKVIVFKYKRKKNYRRNIGHRQPITRIRITGITGYEEYPASVH